MDDFSSPGQKNKWGYYPAKANYIRPGKRPLSSMSPTIVTNPAGDVVMVAGASGGSRIITAVALVIMFLSNYKNRILFLQNIYHGHEYISEIFFG